MPLLDLKYNFVHLPLKLDNKVLRFVLFNNHDTKITLFCTHCVRDAREPPDNGG